MANTLRIKRRTADATAPSTLASGELAYNEVGGILYYGKGNNGSAVATSIVKLGGESLDASYLTTGTIPAGRMPAFTGDVTTSAGAVATTIAANAVSLAKMAQVATLTLLGRVTAATGNVEALTAAQAKTVLAIAQADVAGLTTASSPTFAGGTLTGELLISYASGRLRVTDGTNTLVMGMWDGSNVRIETSGRPLYVVSYGGAISLGRSSGTNLVIDTSSVSWGSNALLHAGNYASYSTFSGAGTFIGNIAITTDASSGDYSLIAHKYAGVTKAFSGYNGGLAIYGGETGIATRIQAGGQYAITALTNGNVGIGTTSPASKLHVSVANGTSDVLKIESPSTNNIVFGGVASGLTYIRSLEGSFEIGNTFSGGDLRLKAGNVERLRITSAGDVGIGTTSPANTLSLSRTGSTPILQLYSDRSAGSGGSSQLMQNRILFGGVNNQGWSTPDGAGIDFSVNYPTDGSSGKLNFWTYPSTTASPNMTIWESKVGIGTTSPSATLHVIGSSLLSTLYSSGSNTTSFTLGTDAWIKLATIPNYSYATIKGEISAANS